MNSQNSPLKTHGVAVAVTMALVLVLGVSLIPATRASSLTFTTIDPPGSTFTLALDINASGDIVGNYVTADGRTHRFLLWDCSWLCHQFCEGSLEWRHRICSSTGLNKARQGEHYEPSKIFAEGPPRSRR
jgi:hypothetical protein